MSGIVLKNMTIEFNFSKIELPHGRIPQSIVKLLEHAVKALEPSRIILFGSRATGKAHEKSDFDIAFEFEQERENSWYRFLCDANEMPLTLYKRDLINLNNAPVDFKKRILTEGITIFKNER